MWLGCCKPCNVRPAKQNESTICGQRVPHLCCEDDQLLDEVLENSQRIFVEDGVLPPLTVLTPLACSQPFASVDRLGDESPVSGSSGPHAGDIVRIDGLQTSVELNGRCGLFVKKEDERAQVKIIANKKDKVSSWGKVVSVKLENLTIDSCQSSEIRVCAMCKADVRYLPVQGCHGWTKREDKWHCSTCTRLSAEEDLAEKPVKIAEAFQCLQLDGGKGKNTPRGEVMGAFRQTCLRVHPDKGGSDQLFTEAQGAYQTLLAYIEVDNQTKPVIDWVD